MSSLTRGKGGDALLNTIKRLSSASTPFYYIGTVTAIAPFKVRLQGDKEDLDDSAVIWSRDVLENVTAAGEKVMVWVLNEGQLFHVSTRVVI